MIIINTISSEYFSLNGINFAKIYQPLQQGLEDIGIYNIYDTRQQLLNSTKYDEYEIDSSTYGTQALTIAALLPVIFNLFRTATYNESNIAVVAAWSFVVPKEFQLDHIRVFNGVGAASNFIMTVGTSLEGDDIVDADMGAVLLSRGTRPLVFDIGDRYSTTASQTIYITITGANPVANISARLSLDI